MVWYRRGPFEFGNVWTWIHFYVENRMRILGVMVLFLLVSCAARTPLAELEEEAEMTGDWTAVQRHKKMDRAMNRVQPENECPRGDAWICHNKGELKTCGCVSPLDPGLRGL